MTKQPKVKQIYHLFYFLDLVVMFLLFKLNLYLEKIQKSFATKQRSKFLACKNDFIHIKGSLMLNTYI
jgi:hypothetical protein